MRRSLLVLAALVAAAASAQQVTLDITSDDATAGGTFVVHAQRLLVSGTLSEPLSRECAVAGRCAIALPEPGVWTFTSGDPRFWAPPQTVTGDAAVPFRVFATAPVSGEVTAPSDVPFLRLRFRGRGERPVEGEVRCPIAASRWSCNVPRGRWDVRLRAAGYVSHFLWDTEIGADRPNHLPSIAFKRGASLVGRVEAARDVTLKGVRVLLLPGDRTAIPNEKGFFHFDGVAPGEYTIAARGDGVGSEGQRVVVIADREAELRAPLLVARPGRIEVAIAPPLDFDGNAWRVSLERLDAQQRYPVTESAADPAGRWSFAEVRPGMYRVAVHDRRGNRWFSSEVEVDRDRFVPVVVLATAIRGSLHLGEKPIEGRIVFNGASTTIAIDANDEGTFHGRLPSAEQAWTASIEAPLYRIKRTIAVELEGAGDGEAMVKLVLPAGAIAGRVVDEKGTSVEQGWVEVAAADGSEAMLQVDIEDDGSFVMNGLAPGAYSVKAVAPVESGPRTSDVQTLKLGDDPAEVTLVVRSARMVSGRVISASGPVTGAEVHLLPTDREWLTVPLARTDSAGRFTAQLPPGTREADVHVRAPGFATRLYHTVLTGELLIVVNQAGGSLQLELPERHADPARAHPWLLHQGALVHAAALAEWGSGGTVIAGPVEPGAWTLCIATEAARPQLRAGSFAGAQCATATVAPFGTARLRPIPR